jgi:hypothetical protein
MARGVLRGAQQLVCVCANEFRGAADRGEYRKLLGKDGGRRIATPGSEPKFVATVLAPKDANFGVATSWYDSH